jgi:RNA polymerase sigma factor (sigma-70 family)
LIHSTIALILKLILICKTNFFLILMHQKQIAKHLSHIKSTELVQLDKLILDCKMQLPKAQEALYSQYVAIMFGICRRYIKDTQAAEDVMQEGFYKIFTKIDQYQNQGSFEGWMKRIMVNESLMYLRKENNFNVSLEVSHIEPAFDQGTISNMAVHDIMKCLDLLPTGYRTIFNMYVVEGYKHREIGEILNISINTSKSQLILAKKRLIEILKKKDISKVI